MASSGENRAGVKTAYHGGLKSFDTQTNSAQAVVGQRLTDAFGNQISSSGVWKGRFAYGGPYGYQEDPDTGLRLLGHRYYDSSTGRFLTRDPIRDGRNLYVYCDSNPVALADPTGLVKITAYFYAVAGVGHHWFVVIEDNVKGSPTYGQRWYVTGKPEDHWRSSNLVAVVEDDDRTAYDGPTRRGKERPLLGGVVLVDDGSPAKPWVDMAVGITSYITMSGHDYDPLSWNSNSVFYEVLKKLGLLDEFERAIGKREKAGHKFPWSPGFAPLPPRWDTSGIQLDGAYGASQQ